MLKTLDGSICMLCIGDSLFIPRLGWPNRGNSHPDLPIRAPEVIQTLSTLFALFQQRASLEGLESLRKPPLRRLGLASQCTVRAGRRQILS